MHEGGGSGWSAPPSWVMGLLLIHIVHVAGQNH